jgi:hypothetical protein
MSAPTLRWIFRLAAEGASMTAIAERLRANNVPPPAGAAWTRIAVRHLLSSAEAAAVAPEAAQAARLLIASARRR